MIKAYIKGINKLPKDFTESWGKDEKGDYIEINKEHLLTFLLGINKLSGSPVSIDHNREGYVEIII